MMHDTSTQALLSSIQLMFANRYWTDEPIDGLTPIAVPEPSSRALPALGLGGVGQYQVRRPHRRRPLP